MKTTPKRTAANNALLATVKATFNAAIFKRAAEILNTLGSDACLDYVVGFYREDIRAEKRAALAPLADARP